MKEPWELYPNIWKNQTAYFTYLRGQIRLTWSRYPAKLEWKKKQMSKPPRGYVGKAKMIGTCHYCEEGFAQSHLEVDHVQQAGQCNSWETAAKFLQNLLDCNDNWVLACKPCHKIKSYAERMDITFEEARVQKEVIELMKKPVAEVIEFCKARGYNDVSNKAKREAAIKSILKEKLNEDATKR